MAALALVACGGADDTDDTEQSDDKEASVVVATFNFQPDPLVVAAGTTITFVNEDAIDHTVTAGTREQPTPQVFDGQLAQQGATFELTLDEPGTYEYFCQVHPGPGMTASITVE
ncbi:MAG: plastocyanin/azurin family copper-binding protein [Ilumatobacteraceae bacterium]